MMLYVALQQRVFENKDGVEEARMRACVGFFARSGWGFLGVCDT